MIVQREFAGKLVLCASAFGVVAPFHVADARDKEQVIYAFQGEFAAHCLRTARVQKS